jgi:hypothetical protein
MSCLPDFVGGSAVSLHKDKKKKKTQEAAAAAAFGAW